MEIGPSLPAAAARGFRQYLGGRMPEFPYLCDPDLAIHSLYGLQPVGPGELLEIEALSALAQVTERSFVRLEKREMGRITAHPMQLGLFIIDEAGVVRYVYVTTPSGKLPTAADLLRELDS